MHEELIGPRIGAHDVGRTQTHIAPCGQPVRRQGGQRLPDELGDIRRAFIVPAGRGRLGGAEHRVVGNHDAQRAEPALVAWSLRICNRFEDRLGSRHQGASRAVDRAGDRGAGTGEVDRHLVPGHRDADVDRDLRRRDPVAVDVVVGRVDAVGDLGDRLPARALAMVEDVGKGMPQRADAITGADFLQAFAVKPQAAAPGTWSTPQVRQTLEAILTTDEDPPPSLKQVAKLLGCAPRSLSKHHPELCRAISARYLAAIQERKQVTLQQRCEEVRQAARQLAAQGKRPTRKKLAEVLTQPGMLRSPEIREAGRTVLQEIDRTHWANFPRQFSMDGYGHQLLPPIGRCRRARPRVQSAGRRRRAM